VYRSIMPYNNLHICVMELIMTTKRLDVRLDQKHHKKLQELAAHEGVPVSEIIRRLIDRIYEDDILKPRRILAAKRLGEMEVEDMPDPDTLNRQLGRIHHEPGSIS